MLYDDDEMKYFQGFNVMPAAGWHKQVSAEKHTAGIELKKKCMFQTSVAHSSSLLWTANWKNVLFHL